MGYFDGLASGSFKTTEDGRKFFFPWGVLGNGYAIATEQDYQRLLRQMKLYLVVGLAAVILAGMYDPYRAPFAVAAVSVCFYSLWMWRTLPRMTRSEEQLSLRDSMTTQARAHGPMVLWTLEIASIIFVMSGIGIIIFDPGSRLMGVFCTAFFGLCAAKIGRLLMLRRRMAAPQA